MRCDPAILWTLVEQSQEPGDETRGLLEHIERCRECQAALRSMGGNESWWSDAQRWLGDPHEPESESEGGGGDGPAASDIRFLQPPRHPEMLGRLGRYDVEGIIGRGGMGIVFRGFDSDLQRCVAIKVLAPHYAHLPLARQRFAREAQAAASVVHENVLPIFNVEADEDPPFLVMPYISGATLERFVAEHGCPDAITVLRIARQIGEGLRAAHGQQLIHRDIKPGNILVTENVHRVWITDFGLARAVDDATLTHSGVIAGTPHFMSPEQARGQRLDARSDLYSFGALLYFLCTGRPPFEADSTLAVLHHVVASEPPSLAAARPDLPPAFVTLVGDLLRKNPSQRPSNADAVAKRVSKAMAEANSGIRVQMTKRRQRVRICAGLLAVTVALAAATVGVAHRFNRDAVQPTTVAIPGGDGAVSSRGARLLGELIRRVGHELTISDTEPAVRRASVELSHLEQQPAVDLPVRLDPARKPTEATGAQAASIASALERLDHPDAESLVPMDADPTRPLTHEINHIRRRLDALRARDDFLP